MGGELSSGVEVIPISQFPVPVEVLHFRSAVTCRRFGFLGTRIFRRGRVGTRSGSIIPAGFEKESGNG